MDTSGIKYIGSKFNLLDAILAIVNKHVKPAGPVPSMIDVFTGTTRVAQAFRQSGWKTQTSDLSWASECYAETFLQMNENEHLIPALDALNKVQPKAGWLTTNYCDVLSAKGTVVRVWQPHNGQKADAIRDRIDKLGPKLTKQEKSTLITSLIFGLDRVDNTVGIQQAYLKNWCKRSYNDLVLTLPHVVTMAKPPPSKHYVGDCLNLTYEPADLAYVDPPYSTHTYFSYYHIWDSIARWDKPEVGLKTNRRIDRVTSADEYDGTMSSPWNSRVNAAAAFEQLIQRLPARYILISYNNESLVPIEDLIALCRKYGITNFEQIDYRRNIMSQIGNGEIGAERNLEYLILLKKN
jgi:adenine-specific DNA-methyltransferase